MQTLRQAGADRERSAQVPTAAATAGIAAPIILMPHDAVENSQRELEELVSGLSQPQARVSPKYLYDTLGSRLFEAITELPEYYPTRTERALFEHCGADIARLTGTQATLIDLGAGNCEKAKRLFALLQPSQYVAIDVAVDVLRTALGAVQSEFPGIDVLGIGADIGLGIVLPAPVRRNRRLFFYPGSSIGNFSPDQALSLLMQVRQHALHDGGLLIGVDLVKPADVLRAAYDDALGVTAAFNLNLLNNVNKAAGADFAPSDWQHLAAFNAQHSRIEMYLEARRNVRVAWRGGARNFRRGERIHTENSCKYGLEQFETLLQTAGFGRVHRWTDARQWFALYYAAV